MRLGKGSAVVLAGVLAACQTLPDIPDRPAADTPGAPKYRFSDLTKGPGNSDGTLILLSFSGGGARAAAMAYGVLESLNATRIGGTGRGGRRRSLLSEVDVISGTSGGSFTAAFYGLYRSEMFARGKDGLSLYERRYLKRPVTRQLTRRLFRNIVRINTAAVNRSDIAAAYYGDTIFDDKTYTDLRKAGRPFVVLNANDTTKQSRFVFTQDQFDLICGTLDGYPVARAVTASSAVDGVFAPIKLRNFAPTTEVCPALPRWVAAAIDGRPKGVSIVEGPRDRLRRAHLARWYKNGEPFEQKPVRGQPYFVHLGDGGAIDNMGLWPILLALGSPISDWGLQEVIASGRVRRVMLIVVDATNMSGGNYDRKPAGPTVVQMVGAAVNSAIDQSSRDAIRAAEVLFNRLRRRYAVRRRTARGVRPKVTFHGPIVIDFASIRNPVRRRCFAKIETALDLPAPQVDALRQLSVQQLESDPRYRAFLKETGGRRVAELTFGRASAFCPAQ